MNGRPRQASRGFAFDEANFSGGLIGAPRTGSDWDYVGVDGTVTGRFLGWDTRRPKGEPWGVERVPRYRVKAPSRPMPAEAGA